MSDVSNDGFVPLFDGVSLAGWHAAPRIYGSVYPGGPSVLEHFDSLGLERPVEPEKHPARWKVEDGVLVGEQDAPGSGYGGFFGNGLASFSAVPFAIDVVRDDAGRPTGLVADNPATSVEPVTEAKRDRLSYAADVDDFLKVWRWDDWNELRIRCVGAMPVITTWINGVKIAELDTATLESPNYDADAVFEVLGDRGHIALEVHDNDSMFGEARWGVGAQCRWRNIRIKELPAGSGGGSQ